MKRLFTLILFAATACVPSLEDCSSKADVLEAVWVVKEVYIDNARQEPTSYAAYRLNLQPQGAYERSQPAGFADSGSWSLASGETVLVLQPNISPEEDYVIESFDLRQLVLVLNRNSSKAGPSQIRYVLIPETL